MQAMIQNKPKTNGFIQNTLTKHMLSVVGAYLLGCLSVVITGIMVGILVDSNGLAAVSLCLPVYYLFAAVGTLIHTGTSALAAAKLGKKDMRSANRYYTLAYIASLICSLVILAFGLLFTDEIAVFLGAKGELLEVTRDYLRILMLGAPAALFMYFPINYLRITAKSFLAPICYLIQAIASVVLTYILIVFFKMGAPGAALATVLSNYILAVLGIIFVVKHSDFSFASVKHCKQEISEMMKSGSPVALDSVGCLIRVLLLNYIAYRIAGTVGVCIIAIVTSVSEFCVAFLLGIPQSTVSLVAIFNSEKDTLSVRQTIKASIQMGLAITSVFALVVVICAPLIAKLYGISDPTLNAVAANSIRVFAPGLIFGLVTCSFATLYATTNNSVLANSAMALRNFVVVVPIALLLERLSKNIVVLTTCLPISEMIALGIVLIAAAIIDKTNKRKNGIFLLDDSVEKSGRIAAFSVPNTSEDIVRCSQSVTEFCETNDLSAKISMALSLAIEEMLMVVSEKCLENNPNECIDVRLFCAEDIVGLRIRNGGKRLNILEYAEQNPDDMDCMGIAMITKLSDVVEYLNTFGANNLLVILK